MIDLAAFLAAISRNAARVREYLNGGDGTGGKCDCIGLIIGALRLIGIAWPWTHGSNYAARYRVRGLRAVASASALRLGELVFKSRSPGDNHYSLPSSYKGHPDRMDYYHVGVVTRLNPLEITHCSTGGIHRDGALGAWRWAGELNLVNYDEGAETPMEKALYQAAAYAEQGSTVNIRRSASIAAPVVYAVPIGGTVDVLEETNESWAKVRSGDKTGYMMRRYIKATGNAAAPSALTRESLTALKATLVPLLREIEAALEEGGEQQ